MTEEIKYNKDEKWIPYKQLAETPQQIIARLEQENKELKEELKQANEDFSCIEKDYRLLNKQINALMQENKELKEMYRLSCLKCEYKNTKADVDKYRSALEEIKKLATTGSEQEDCYSCEEIIFKIDEVLQ